MKSKTNKRSETTKVGEILEHIHDHRTAGNALPRLAFCENSPSKVIRRP